MSLKCGMLWQLMANGKKPKNLKRVKLKMNFSWKNLIIYAFFLLFVGFIFLGLNQSTGSFSQNTKTVSLSHIIADVKAGKVSSIDVLPNKLTVHEKSGDLQSFKEESSNIYQLFKDAGVPLDKTNVVITDET